jgi:WD40 repeat protein
LRAELVGHSKGGWGCRWSPTGEYLATASYDHTDRIWNSSGEEVLVLPHEHVVIACAWSPTGDRILTLAQTEEA